MTRLERERAAIKSGIDVDAVFSNTCKKLGLKINVAQITPLALVALAEIEAEDRRRESAAR